VADDELRGRESRAKPELDRGKKDQAKARGLLHYADGATCTAACAATNISGSEQCTEMHRCLGALVGALLGALACGCRGWWVRWLGG
jgi:hypothetical protein